MPHLSNAVPKYRPHKSSGQAVVWLNGRDIYLGPYKSAASKAEYNRLIAEWLAAGRRLPDNPAEVTIAEIAVAFRRHAQKYYRDAEGKVSRELENFNDALRPLLKLYGRTPAVDFGPLRLKTVREAMVADGLVRTTINRRVSRVRQVFKWAAENELAPANIYHALEAVAGLRVGRSEAKEGTPVKPVPAAWVEATTPHLSSQVAAMVELQRITGMRPGELCAMRGCDLDTSGKLWVYRPAKHKTAIHGHTREVYLGPRAQEVLRPFLKLDTQSYLFSPAEAAASVRERRQAERRTPLSCGNRAGTNRRINPKRSPGDQYDVATYRRAIKRACERASVPAWHPHQLRHTAATELRKSHGLEAAQVLLGHRTLQVTQIYAEKNIEAAMKIAAQIG